MRIGFSSIYSWRPHVEHLHYLAGLARDAGHYTSFLTCDANLETCYTKELRPERHSWVHCARCRVGGIRSYVSDGISSIGHSISCAEELPENAERWSFSSASTLGRFETDAEYSGEEFHSIARRLHAPTAQAYIAALRWIERERLDAICLFNGRMDVTRAVLEAARTAKIPFVSMERTWFGDGLQLLPNENCLGLRSVGRMMSEWQHAPLEEAQALRAASLVASRFLRRNGMEWRAYNVDARIVPWPKSEAKRRILLIPGSRNEIWGHPDRASKWDEPTAAYDALMEHLDLDPSDLVLRCHPNWGETIAHQSGIRSERYFTDWARRRGIHVIASADSASTLGLIEQADAIVVSGGSAAFEAGSLGKQVIAMAPSIYQHAGFESPAYTAEQLGNLLLNTDRDAGSQEKLSEEIAKKTLRFAYTMNYRVAQFVPYVRCLTTTRFEYREGADVHRLTRLLQSGHLEADDTVMASQTVDEHRVLELIRNREWQSLIRGVPASGNSTAVRPVHRRWIYRPIDRIREALPRGDR